ncbi:MAG TPA: extracellular solute-binding protein [Chloroflexota bacterium]|nr:extracellular solute-binding protein [Chloroflexota bacterium]
MYRQFFLTFQNKFGINVEVVAGGGGADIGPRVSAERQAGQYLYDVVVHGAAVGFETLKPLGALDPLRSALILPEVLDNSKWRDGFDAGWADSGKSLVYSFASQVDWNVRLNRAVVPESQLSRFDQLWDPRWKGKIVWFDPRVPGTGAGKAGIVLYYKGEDKLRTIFRDQQLVLSQDNRQIAESILRGQQPIGVGVDVRGLADLQTGGADVSSIQPLADNEDPAARQLTSSTGAIGLVNRALHPNAAKALINWILSQDGQTAYTKTGYNSRRLDAPAVDAERLPESGKQYVDLNTETGRPTFLRAVEIAKAELK